MIQFKDLKVGDIVKIYNSYHGTFYMILRKDDMIYKNKDLNILKQLLKEERINKANDFYPSYIYNKYKIVDNKYYNKKQIKYKGEMYE